MTPSKIIPESKQKNKPEALRPFLNSPKPAFNTVPRSESYVNKIQPQTVKR